MALQEVIAHIDAEILRLQHAKELLTGGSTPARPGRGRPKGSKNVKSAATVAPKKAKRRLSPEGRKAIADAMKRRWAERRKQTAK